LLSTAATRADLGEDFGHGLTAAEVDHLVTREWARTAEDILWRRTKLGLRFTPEQTARLDAHLTTRSAERILQA
jgi:glycerol-3-phosphate dehydrogenase